MIWQVFVRALTPIMWGPPGEPAYPWAVLDSDAPIMVPGPSMTEL
jgi:hypothetical protein